MDLGRKGGTGGGGWVSTLGPNNMAASVESPWSALGEPFLSSFAQMGLENGLQANVGPTFLAVKVFSCSISITIGQEPDAV